MERRRLNELLTALQFTRLELLRMPAGAYDERKADLYLESLYGYTAFSGMKNYREAFGSVQSYLEEWNILKTENRESQNPLKGIRLSCQPAEDETQPLFPCLPTGFMLCLPTIIRDGSSLRPAGSSCKYRPERFPTELFWSFRFCMLRLGTSFCLLL